MSIEFLLDTLKEDEKKDIKKIIETIKQKPRKVDKNAVFLKRFILASMKQYKRKSEPRLLDHHREMLKNLKIEEPLKQKPLHVPLPNRVPKEYSLFPKTKEKPVELVPEVPKPV